MNNDDLNQNLRCPPLRALPREWRAEILAAAKAQAFDPARLPATRHDSTHRVGDRRSDLSWWLAWLNPSRAGWTALGAVWFVIITLNFAGSAGSTKAHGPSVAASTQQWRERQRLMAELIEPAEPTPTHPVPRPRSERRVHPSFHHA